MSNFYTAEDALDSNLFNFLVFEVETDKFKELLRDRVFYNMFIKYAVLIYWFRSNFILVCNKSWFEEKLEFCRCVRA